MLTFQMLLAIRECRPFYVIGGEIYFHFSTYPFYVFFLHADIFYVFAIIPLMISTYYVRLIHSNIIMKLSHIFRSATI